MTFSKAAPLMLAGIFGRVDWGKTRLVQEHEVWQPEFGTWPHRGPHKECKTPEI